MGEYAASSPETSGVATKSLCILVVCTFPKIPRTNFSFSPCYSVHLSSSRPEIILAVPDSRFQVFQLLMGGVGKCSLSQCRKANCLYSWEVHPASDLRSLHRPLNLSRCFHTWTAQRPCAPPCYWIPAASKPDIRGCGTTHV